MAAIRQQATRTEPTIVPRVASAIPDPEPAAVPGDALPARSIALRGCVTTTLLEAPVCEDTIPVVLAEDPVPVPICETGRSAVSAGLSECWGVRSRRFNTSLILSSAR
jgi:hypothetical protein